MGSAPKRPADGGVVSINSVWQVSEINRDRVARGVFPPEEVAQVKAIACELPREQGVPLSRFARAELHRFVIERGVCEASASTIGRLLAEDAIKPWQHRSWIFPRDPDSLEKAGRILDLYEGRWGGKPLEPGDMVEYERLGALTYFDAWDVRRGKVMGRSEHTGRVFWIVDNGSDHRGKASIKRLECRWPNLILVHTRCTPPGSTRSGSITRSSNAKCSPPTTSPTPPKSRAH